MNEKTTNLGEVPVEDPGGLVAVVEAAVESQIGWATQVSAGLRAGLEFLAARPPLARRLFVEPLTADAARRLEYERGLERLARALRQAHVEHEGGIVITAETAQLLAGGVASHLSGRLLAGGAERLPESHDLLLRYLLAPSFPAASRDAARARVACG